MRGYTTLPKQHIIVYKRDGEIKQIVQNVYRHNFVRSHLVRYEKRWYRVWSSRAFWHLDTVSND